MKEKNIQKLSPYEKLEEVVPYIIAYQRIKYDYERVRELSEEINQIIDKFQLDDLLRLIITKVEPYVRNYPQIAFRKTNEDLKSDFFIYIYERFESILEKYNHTLGKFSNYLSIKLKNYFLNYVRRAKIMNKIKYVNYEVDTTTESIFKDRYNLELSVAERETSIREKHEENQLLDNLKKEPFRYLCVKLYFFELFTEKDFKILVEYLNLEEDNLTKLREDIAYLSEEIHRKKLVKIYYENCLNKAYYHDMLRKEELYDIKMTKKKDVEIKEILSKQERINERRGALLQKYYAVNTFPSMKTISKVLRTESTKVSNIINYYKQYLSKKDFTS